MRPPKHTSNNQQDLFRQRLDNIINMLNPENQVTLPFNPSLFMAPLMMDAPLRKLLHARHGG